eukprot:CAMPEP_0194371126 /NCGR_PEP_ID=MMETSP0174-20130528/19500_1 /TAXON_ID=216777 /ORGANISM="Proboscia alata, Strain PI-D3" /LENGTH=440 /DNA_ID=CAMNT_0039148989 /DNA_START=59 /DNA_END=1381 /DNA_ORIENTATION=-
MGIKGLAKLLADEAPGCVKEVPLSSLQSRKIAIDASMAIYQFLIAVRSGGPNVAATMLTNADGETTSHIQGLFNRTIRYMTEGIRPVYVFDGKPPQFKSGELLKRREKREKAEKDLEAAMDSGNIEEQDKQSKRLVRAGQKENNDCMDLLRLMGVPIVKAPCEAEAQCAAMANAGLVYAVATEDMDALTFKTPVLLRKMTFVSGSKSDIQTMSYPKAIQGLDITHDMFVDLCIMMGCDYCDTIRGIGPKTALKLIREHKCIEEILKNIDRERYHIPDSWIPNEARAKEEVAEKEREKELEGTDEEDNKDNKGDSQEQTKNTDEKLVPIYVEARRLFNFHEVLTKDEIDLKWLDCKPAELTKFLVEKCGFNADRVKSSIERLQKAHKSSSKPQMRMDSFFAMKPSANAGKLAAKRKATALEAKKKGKGGSAKKSKGSFKKR